MFIMEKEYDVIIVGGGIIGTAVLYVLTEFTDIKNVLMIEKHKVGEGSSASWSNSQTLHVGDIETNYGINKIIETRTASRLILKYTDKFKQKGVIAPVQKMVLGVGDEEVETLSKRYDDKFISLFPDINVVDKKDISKLEPYVVKKRDKNEKIIAAYSKNGHMVNFGMLSGSFVSFSIKNNDHLVIKLKENVEDIEKITEGYSVKTNKGNYKGRFVIFASGGYSLYFAKKLGYGKDLSILSVAGNFYYSKNVIKGKVYRVQKGGIPFAAVHADADIADKKITRYGPTVNIVPFLEHSDIKSTYKYIKAMGFDKSTVQSLINISEDKDIQHIIEKNLIYSIPDLGKYYFLKEEVNKIIPSLKYNDIKFYKNGGGIRPQIIDKKRKKLILGVVDLRGEGVEFSMAPSPGASSCIKEGLKYSLSAVEYLGKKFYKEKFIKMFCDNEEEYKILTSNRKH
ncbi:MAG: FAD-dependent oxidoreductase [Candidatus Parvarchaeum sp.]